MSHDSRLPRHVAVIPDGNRRWAKERGLPGFMGHQRGAEMVEQILQRALDCGIPYFTFWGCSVDNVTKRDAKEVAFLFALFERYFKKLLKSKVIHERRVRIRVLGNWENYFPNSTKQVIRALIDATSAYGDFHLTFLLAYSGYEEMLRAIARIAELSHAKLAVTVDRDVVKANLLTADLPAVDLVVRTGGEPHWSAGFMMWDTADAQFYFTPTHWPAFTPDEFDRALVEYGERERRLGK